MFCSDDKHPDDLLEGHMDRLAARAVQKGHDPLDVLRCACVTPVLHYGLPVGLLRVGDPMDAALVEDLERFRVQRTWLRGELAAEEGTTPLPSIGVEAKNRFHARPITVEDLTVLSQGETIRVMEALDGELITNELQLVPRVEDGKIAPDVERDILMICVLNRYRPAAPAVAFIRGFGLQKGAIASSVAHDSHNIVAVGADPHAICRAVNGVVAARGGIALSDGAGCQVLELPVAGIMSPAPAEEVGRQYAELDRAAKALGSPLRAPFMTLSFMALLVIPALKLSDKGLFDGRNFRLTGLYTT